MKTRLKIRHALWVLALIAPLAAAQGAPASVPPAYRKAAQAHAVPPTMLYALSLTESAARLSYGRRPWPWTLDIDGRGVRYVSRSAACMALHQALHQTTIIDVGLGQLNVHWQRALFGAGGRFAKPCAALDPYANLDAAAALLARCHVVHPASWVQAAGCYHRPAGGPPAARYRRAFKAQLARIGHDSADGVRLAAGNRPPGKTNASAHGKPAATVSTRSGAPTARVEQVTWINPEPEDPHGLD